MRVPNIDPLGLIEGAIGERKEGVQMPSPTSNPIQCSHAKPSPKRPSLNWRTPSANMASSNPSSFNPLPVDEATARMLSLVENLQREDLRHDQVGVS